MTYSESALHIPTRLGSAPALVMTSTESPKATVLVIPGLGAAKEIQRKEMRWLAAAGYRAVAIDAPHHGERIDNYLHPERLSDPHLQVMRLVKEAVAEMPDIVAYCAHEWDAVPALCGISLGGFITFGAVPMCRLSAAIPILGSPAWSRRDGQDAGPALAELLPQAPVNFPHRFAPCPLLVIGAGRDVNVPPHLSRVFVDRLKSFYQPFPDHLRYVEYPESEHFMREEDWNDTWRQVIAWLDRFTPQQLKA